MRPTLRHVLLGDQARLPFAVKAIDAGPASARLSVGGKGSELGRSFKKDPNEDGLAILQDGDHWVLAVADAHYGAAATTSLLTALASKPAFASEDQWPSAILQSLSEAAPSMPSEAALLVVRVDEPQRKVTILSWADAGLYWIDQDQALGPLNQPGHNFIAGAMPGELLQASLRSGSLSLPPNPGLLLLCTDGVFECCYRKPKLSIRNRHLKALAERVGLDPKNYADALAQMALDGVDGNPGGEDNIAIVTLAL